MTGGSWSNLAAEMSLYMATFEELSGQSNQSDLQRRSTLGNPVMKAIHPLNYGLAGIGACVLSAVVVGILQDSMQSPAVWLHDPLAADAVVEQGPAATDETEAGSGNPQPAEAPGSLARPSQEDLNFNSVLNPSAGSGPVLETSFGAVEIFPGDNPWNTRIDQLPVHSKSDTWIQSIGADTRLHPDFGTVWQGRPNGIPFVVVSPAQAGSRVAFEYADESDVGPYPIPPNPPIEGGPDAEPGSDRHLIMIDPRKKLLYELFQVFPRARGGWKAGSGAIFDLSTNRVRPAGWTSADAAGLPIFPGLVRYDEVAAGEIRHALRFTVEKTQRGYIFPARHFASRSDDRRLPPLGLRVRLKKDFDSSRFPESVRVILICLQRYGMLLADNGGDWFISGAPDQRWSDEELSTLKRITGHDLECVVTGLITRM